jgi:hypothetical protein
MTKNNEGSEKYNGWTNYETWRVRSLEMIDGMTLDDMGVELTDDDDRSDITAQIAEALEAHVLEFVEMDSKGFALDLAHSFLARVDWMEIAEHMVEDSLTLSN